MRVLNGQYNPGYPATARNTLFPGDTPPADGTAIQTLDGGTRWQAMSSAATAQRVGSENTPGSIVALGGLWTSSDNGGYGLRSAKIIDTSIAYFGNCAVEGDFILPAGVPTDDWDRSGWLNMNGQHTPAAGAGNPWNGGMVLWFNTAGIGFYSSTGEDGGGAVARQSIAIASGRHTLRLERQAKIFRGYVDGALLITLDLTAHSTATIDQYSGSIGFGLANTMGTTYAGCGLKRFRVTTL